MSPIRSSSSRWPGRCRRWVDLGSGGGFPGLVVAAVLADRPDADVTLVESDTRKAAFLREAARIAELPVTVLPARIEQVAPRIAAGVEVVSARALAPLPKLLLPRRALHCAGSARAFSQRTRC